jgi:hypothetical protein
VVKLVYSAEWEASLVESHPRCEATDAALAQHREGVAVAARALAPYAGEIDRLAAACASSGSVGGGGGGGAGGGGAAAVSWF